MGSIPQELLSLNQWVAWRTEIVNGKETKVPYRCNGSGRAESDNPSTWSDYGTAVAFVRNNQGYGLGFMLSNNGHKRHWFADLDDTELASTPPEVKAYHYQLMQWFGDTYIERSPSGDGYHIVGEGQLPEHSCKPGAMQFELYSKLRFMTITGDNMEWTPALRQRKIGTVAVGC